MRMRVSSLREGLDGSAKSMTSTWMLRQRGRFFPVRGHGFSADREMRGGTGGRCSCDRKQDGDAVGVPASRRSIILLQPKQDQRETSEPCDERAKNRE